MFYNYKLTFSGTHYVYAGSTNNPERRLAEHRRSCLGKKPQNPKLAYVWKKHGDPAMTILGTFKTENEMLEHEQFLIDQIFGESVCLNLSPFASKPPGFPKGKKLSSETKAKMSASRTGMKHSQETKIKQSVSMTGKKKLNLAVTVVAIDPFGNETTFYCARECSKQIEIDHQTIWRLMNSGKIGKWGKAKGWSFRKAT